ncbi:MAG: hypothetical protein RXO54_06980 [Acidilobus sp.]|jgi:hypothetical protein
MLTNQVLNKLVKKLHNYVSHYATGMQNHFRWFFEIQPRLDLVIKDFEWGAEVNMRIYIDEPDINRIRESIRRQLMDRKLRIAAYENIKAGDIKISSGELYAILSGVHSSPPEGGPEAGGDRAEVRDQEGGHPPESAQ